MFSTVSLPSGFKSYSPRRCQNLCKKIQYESTLGPSISGILHIWYCVSNGTNWGKIMQRILNNALGFSISIIVSTMTQIGNKNSVNNVSALVFSISIIVSTMTLIGTKLCQQCGSVGVLHTHYYVNNDTNWGKIVSTTCQHWYSPYPLLCQQ